LELLATNGTPLAACSGRASLLLPSLEILGVALAEQLRNLLFLFGSREEFKLAEAEIAVFQSTCMQFNPSLPSGRLTIRVIKNGEWDTIASECQFPSAFPSVQFDEVKVECWRG